ncbi:MAG: ThiF family adenylyltransferase [Nocardioidaceae bacterium]
MYAYSVAMTQGVHDTLSTHLLRRDGQEDICLATYAVSTGAERTTHLLHDVHLPVDGDRQVHGNATIHGSYVLRIATLAAQRGHGVAILHSHPGGRGWQRLSGPDAEAESSYARLVEQITGLPLVGLTLAGDATWSARTWNDGQPVWVGSVRRVGTTLTVSWNDELVPPPPLEVSQVRTISAWGSDRHVDISRLRLLVVGAGSVGLDVITRLAATGIVEMGIMDFDRVHAVNRDRMVGATRRDARLRRRKVDVAARLARLAATAERFKAHRHYTSICSPEGLAVALDYDIIFSCVDRPWPRAVFNAIAYADLIPMIDGGIAIDTLENGDMRGATRRTQAATPGNVCLACSGQISMLDVTLEMNGDLDDPDYIRRAGRESVSGRPNVAALCAGVSAGQLELFVSLVAHPAGRGVPAPLRFMLAPHHLEHMPAASQPFCEAERRTALGDARTDLCRATGSWTCQAEDGLTRSRRRVHDLIDTFIERLLNR